MSFLFRCLALWGWSLCALAASPTAEYRLGAADVIKISVFQNPDLTLETRISESGQIAFPLIGSVEVGGLSISDAEGRIAARLRAGNFVRSPQVNILLLQLRSAQVSVLGQVGRPGRYPIETVGLRVSDMVAIAGGVVTGASDVVSLVGTRNDKPVRWSVDIDALLQLGVDGDNPVVLDGDTIYVARAPVVYIYGEVQRPGIFRLERNMTVLQGLAQGGGLTPHGTERSIRIHRRDETGVLQVIQPSLTDPLQRDDVVYVRESLF